MASKTGFVNGIYKDIPGLGLSAPVHERAELLRAVSVSLIRAGIDRTRRLAILVSLRTDFGVALSEEGIEQFLNEKGRAD